MSRIWIELQKNVYSLGEEVSGIVHVSLDKPISQRGATIYLNGKERTEISYQRTVQSGKTQQTHTETAVQESEFLHQESPMPLPIDENGKCRPGDHNCPFRFTLRQGLPATYLGRHAKIQYMIAAKIDVPMGLDVRESSQFSVVSSIPQPYQSAPVTAYSDSWGNPQSTGISFTVERGQYGRGEVVSGKCLFRNPSSKDLRKIDIALRWIESATAQNQRSTTEVMRQVVQVPVGGRAFQGETPFGINVPGQAPPTYESSLSNVRCILSASVDIAMGLDVAASQSIGIVESAGYGVPPPPQYVVRQSELPQRSPVQTYQPATYPAANVMGARCPRCGANIPKSDSQYCPMCGSKL